jgi:hypothetical protein
VLEVQRSDFEQQPTAFRQVACDSSMASRLEQLNRIPVGIFNLNLFAAGAYLHFIS